MSASIGAWLAFAGVLAVLVAGAVGLLRYIAVGRRRKLRAVQASFIGPATDLFHPEAHRATRIREDQAELREADALPGDPPLTDGQIVVRLDARPDERDGR